MGPSTRSTLSPAPARPLVVLVSEEGELVVVDEVLDTVDGRHQVVHLKV